jgi:hypothetical protein
VVSRTSCSPNTASICHSIVRVRSTREKVSTCRPVDLADWVGAAAATLMPLNEAIRTHVFAAERIHADDTTVPVLAKGKTCTGRLWTYVRDDRPFGGRDPPATIFFYSADRGGEHPEQHLPATPAGCRRMPMRASNGSMPASCSGRR